MSDRAQPGVSADSVDQVDEALDFAVSAARTAAEHKIEDVAVLDLRGLSGLADFFVIGTGTSERQMHAVLDMIKQSARRDGREPFKIADSASGSWILADYVDVVVHLFDHAHREYYDLESLWGDAPRVEWAYEAVVRRAAEEADAEAAETED